MLATEKIRKDLEKEDSYFIGSKEVKENYEKQRGEKVSTSYVDGVLKEAGMVKSPGKKRKVLAEQIHPPGKEGHSNKNWGTDY